MGESLITVNYWNYYAQQQPQQMQHSLLISSALNTPPLNWGLCKLFVWLGISTSIGNFQNHRPNKTRIVVSRRDAAKNVFRGRQSDRQT